MKTVAIVGMAASSRMYANDEPPDTEVWGLMSSYEFLDRFQTEGPVEATRWFEIHDEDIGEWAPPETRAQSPDHEKWIKNCPIPIYLKDDRDDIPNGIKYPLAQIERRFGRRYLTSTIAYMLALAIFEEFDRIKLFGVNFSSTMEYANLERSCTEFYLGCAWGLGIELVLPADCPLLTGPLYGVEDQKRVLSISEARLAGLRRTAEGLKNKINESVGAYNEAKSWMESIEDEGIAKKGHERLSVLGIRVNSLTAELNGVIGAMRNTQHFAVSLGGKSSEAEQDSIRHQELTNPVRLV